MRIPGTAWLVLLLVAGCDSGTQPLVPPSEDPVVSVVMGPEGTRLAEHGTATIVVVCRDAQGRVTSPRVVLWSSLDPQVAVLEAAPSGNNAMLRGIIPGEARIVARVEDIRDTMTVTVTPLPVDHVTFERTLPDTQLLHAKGQVIAYAYAADGLPVNRPIAYQSTRPDIAVVTADGHVDLVGTGRGGITASAEGMSATDEFLVMSATFTAITSGADHDCAIAASGQLWCWGAGSSGQLGIPVAWDQPTPVPSGGALRLAQVSAGWSHTCGLTAVGTAWCWGGNLFGEVGSGTATSPTYEPTAVATGLRFANISGGKFLTCGADTQHAGQCWGSNNVLQLGSDVTGGNVPPMSDVPTRAIADTSFVRLSAGERNACGITTTGQAICWGDPSLGQTGGVAAGQPVPGGYSFTDISVGDAVVCGLTNTGVAVCWGNALFGATGDGGGNPSGSPAPVVGGLQFAQLAAAHDFVCGLSAGRIYCWGNGSLGSLGNGTRDVERSPVPISSDETFMAVSAGGFHACGLTTGGVIYCWGSRASIVGGLGDGGNGPSTVPVRIPGS